MDKKFKVFNKQPSGQQMLRNKFLKKGIELIDVTQLTELKQGEHGWCNNFNEEDQNIYHIQIWYRGEVIANAGSNGMEVLDDKKYVIYKEDLTDYIIFRKVKTT